MTAPRIVVAGGGISGLVAGFTLRQEAARRNLPVTVTVLDAADEPGGHARTVVEDEWVVERGPNGFLDNADGTRALIQELQLESRVVESDAAARRRYILDKGALRLVPSSPPALLTSDAIGWRGKLRLLAEPFAPPAPSGKDESVFEFASRRLGNEAARTFVDTAVAGISAGDSRALSVRSQFPVLKEWEQTHGSLLKALLKRTGGGGPSRLVSFDGGMRVLTTALASRLNGAFCPQTPIRGIARDNTVWRIQTRESSIIADRVVLALPAHTAATVAATFDANLSRVLADIPYAPIAVVALGYRRSAIARPLDGYGYLVTRDQNLATLGVLWESSIFAGRAPADSVLLRVMLGGARHPEVRDFDDATVVSLAVAEATAVLGISGVPLRQWVFRWPTAIAQYNIGHQARIDAIRRAVGAHPGLTVCGTAYDGVSFNDAIRSAQRAARNVIEELAQ